MPATLHKIPKVPFVEQRRHPSFVLTDSGCHPPDEVLFLAACHYFYDGNSELVTDDMIVRLVWECSGLEVSQWNEDAFLAECRKLYRLAKSRPTKKTLFARVVVQLIRDLITGLFLSEVAHG